MERCSLTSLILSLLSCLLIIFCINIVVEIVNDRNNGRTPAPIFNSREEYLEQQLKEKSMELEEFKTKLSSLEAKVTAVDKVKLSKSTAGCFLNGVCNNKKNKDYINQLDTFGCDNLQTCKKSHVCMDRAKYLYQFCENSQNQPFTATFVDEQGSQTANTYSYLELEVCPEKDQGLYKEDYPYRYQRWTRQNCSYEMDMADLVTVVINYSGLKDWRDRLSNLTCGLQEAYPGVRMIIAVDHVEKVDIDGVDVIAANPTNTWNDLVMSSHTKYVLMGMDLEFVTQWINLHRAVRLLGRGTVAVGGAMRNSTGHWMAPCYQVDIKYYRLEIREGYAEAKEDCMVCGYAGGPILIEKKNLEHLRGDLSDSLMMLDLSLRTKGAWVTCPDIMYYTGSNIGRDIEETDREDWHKFARTWEVQGVVTNWTIQLEQTFSCKDIGMKCDVREQAKTYRLQPWCCHKSFNHIFGELERLALEKGLEYEISDGTVLGAVKMANFMPWDIDADVDYNEDHSQILQDFKGAKGKAPNPIIIHYEGLTVEMWAQNKYPNMSRTYTPPHLQHSPTRIQMTNGLWLRTHANPGLFARGRYGPGIFYHSESWRFRGHKSNENYNPGIWNTCTVPGHHACLSNYPTVGNIGLQGYNYP